MTDFRAELLKAPVPLFPLPDGVLLPGAVLPLTIFEPRYRRMMNEVLAREDDHRLIAIALLKEGFETTYYTNRAAIHPVVCVGRILQHQRLADGRFNILVLGCCRARVVAEDGSGDYRVAQLAPLESQGTIEESEVATELGSTLARAVELKICGGELARMLVDAAPTISCLIDLVAFHFMPPAEYALKQRVLEDQDVKSRAELVVRWFKQATEAAERKARQTADHRHRSMN